MNTIAMARLMVITILGMGIAAILFSLVAGGAENLRSSCKPTSQDALGPFYKPNAPLRTSVGKGYVLSGLVKSSKDCSPIGGARIEFWLAGSDRQYDDDHRAAMLSDKSGAYRFESNFPPGYSGRPPHIHIRVTADGFKTLVAQHYPIKNQTQATFDLVMIPNN